MKKISGEVIVLEDDNYGHHDATIYPVDRHTDDSAEDILAEFADIWPHARVEWLTGPYVKHLSVAEINRYRGAQEMF